jgi:4-alpha-glucanotransferase
MAHPSPPEETVAEQALKRGVQPSYFDIFGREQSAPTEVLAKLIAAVGDPPRSGLEAGTIVIEQGHSLQLPGPGKITLESSESRIAGQNAGHLPLGYHHLETAGRASHLIVCPPRMYGPAQPSRAAGIAISLYGLRSRRNWGVGDFRDLEDFGKWAVRATGAQFLALNPLHAIPNRQPYNTSPYLPASTYFRNFLYLDVEGVDEFRNPSIQQDFESAAVQNEIRALRDAELVEYERVAALKLHFLRSCFKHFEWKTPAFERFLAREGELLRQFAVYSALDEHFRMTMPGVWLWTQWPHDYRHPDSPACARFAQEREADVMFYCWLQWLLDRELDHAQRNLRQSGMSIGLYHDLALATDRFGCDLWSNRDHFIECCRVGAPPDDFAPEGQDWSFPPPNTARHLEDGYQLYAASIRNNARHGGALRMDHVMRLFRLYWIPEGHSAREGAYVHDRWRDLLGVLALESHRQQVRIIGEDLGTVTQEMRDALNHWGVLGYRLLYFEKNGDQFLPPDRYTPTAVASITTHDLPTLAGFWVSADIHARRDAGQLPNPADEERQLQDRRQARQSLLDALDRDGFLAPEVPRDADAIASLTAPLRDACWGFLSATPCELFAVNQEEITGELHQQNIPGSTVETNWRRKMTVGVEDLLSDRQTSEAANSLRASAASFGHCRWRSGRRHRSRSVSVSWRRGWRYGPARRTSCPKDRSTPDLPRRQRQDESQPAGYRG